ncbi:MAG: redox-regulated ATPase YchF [Thermoproteota archaeon]|nr:redox-regulated ATPase YchF [Thermoproteota archaeon]
MVGVVGKPNVGKSTFFSAATLAPAEIASYPFTTIKPNRGVGYIRTPCVCKEFGVKDNPVNSLCLDGVRLIPVELIDCAGLVPGAWKGRGLGNQFLDEIRKADALIHVVDAAGATDSEGKMCKPGSHNPLEDVRFLEVEITMWLVNILQREWSKLARAVEAGAEDLLTELEERVSGLAIRRTHILEALKKTGLNPDKPTKWSEEDFTRFVDTLRRVAKPMLIAANKIDLPTAEENVERLKQLGYIVVPCCAEAELALRRAAEKKLIDYKPGDCNFNLTKPEGLTEPQRRALKVVQEKILRKHGFTGVQKAINLAFFQLLNMIVVYPVEDLEHLSDHDGRVLPDAYMVPYGTTARGLAYLIHTELGEGFLFAVEAHERRRIGEDHMLKDRDVVSIVSTKKRR